MNEVMLKSSLKSKILFGFCITFAVSVSLSILLTAVNFRALNKETILVGATNLTASLRKNIEKQVALTEELDGLQRFSLELSEIVNNASQIDYVRVLSEDFRVLASPTLAEQGKKLDLSADVLEEIGLTRETRLINDEHVVIPIRIEEFGYRVFVVVSYQKDFLANANDTIITYSAVAALMALILAVIVTFWLFNRFIEGPLNEISHAFLRVQEGRLDTRLPDFDTQEFSATGSSIQQLFDALRTAGASLQRIAGATRDQSERIEGLLDRLSVQKGDESEALEKTRNALKTLRITSERNDNVVAKLNMFTEDTSSSVLEMLSNLEEIDDQMGSLNKIIDDTLLKTADMSEGFSQVTGNTSELAQESDDLASSISEIIQSIQVVEQHAATNRTLSETVTQQAQEGVAAINRSTSGMQSIKESVNDVNHVIQELGIRAEEIESILKAINQIAEKTNLLALNAAIIAAQAGEHGRTFTVVADEIRELAAQTSASTRDIEDKVNSVQTETARVTSKMQESLKQVDVGENMLNEAVVTLNAIMDSSEKSDAMSLTIATATVEQAKVSRQIGEVTNRIQSYLHQTAQAMKSQEVSANQLTKSSERVRDLAVSVQRATQEQRDGVARLNSQIESVFELSQELREDTRSQNVETGNLEQAVSAMASSIEDASRSLTELTGQFVALRETSERVDSGLSFLTARVNDQADVPAPRAADAENTQEEPV